MEVTHAAVKSILTRATGYLREVCSHSLQPYRGCTYGNAQCGVACYVRHNAFLLRGARWGSFLEARSNAAEAYLRDAARERRFARAKRGAFSVFLSSATDPFVPQEASLGVTGRVLAAMLEEPPDELIVQTHSHRVLGEVDRLADLSGRCRLRVHVSIESDRERLPGLPPPASTIEARFAAARALRDRGMRVVVTCSPLFPIDHPDAFFARIAAAADAVVLDHFIEGDGTPDGRRTRRTALPDAIARVDPRALDLTYRDAMAAAARRHLPGRVGVGAAGFAGRYS